MDSSIKLLAKIKTLSECAWDNRIKRHDVDLWLENFKKPGEAATKREREHALHLLSQFVYFGHSQMRELIKALYRDHFRCPVLRKIREANGNLTNPNRLGSLFSSQLSRTRFLGMGNPSESGCHLLYFFRQENALSKTHFLHSHEIFSRSSPRRALKLRDKTITHYVFIDDFCGSGNQGVQYSKDIVSDIKALKPSVRVSYYILFATQHGMKRLKKEAKFDDVGCVVELDDTFKVFSRKSRYFTNCPRGLTKKSSRSICSAYGRSIMPSDPLGYNNSQLLIGFYHNTPDNTLPIFWYAEDEALWRPIFKRYNKVY